MPKPENGADMLPCDIGGWFAGDAIRRISQSFNIADEMSPAELDVSGNSVFLIFDVSRETVGNNDPLKIEAEHGFEDF